MKFITGNEKNIIRAELRKLLVAGRLEARRTYYDYYDSCHAPSETPDAAWTKASDVIRKDMLMAGGASLYLVESGVYALSTGYSTYQVRIQGGVK